MDPIATNTGVSKITKEFAAVDFDHTKQEVVHAVERLGEVIAGGLTGIGAAHEGREIPAVSEFWAKKGSASATSAFGKTLHDIEPTTNANNNNNNTVTSAATNAGQNGVTPLGGIAAFSSPAAAWPANTGVPSAGATSFNTASTAATSTSREGGSTASQAQDGSSASAPTLPPVTGGPALYPTDKSAPAAIKIEEPKTSTSQVQKETAKDGAHAPALNGNIAGSSTTGSGNTGATTAGSTTAVAPSSGATTTAAAPSASHTGATTAATAGTAASAAAASSATADQHAGHHDKKQPSVIDDLKKGIKGGHDSVTNAPTGTAQQGGMLGAPAVADHESHGLINDNKRDAAHLGLPAIPTEASSKPPTTPKKTAAVGTSATTGTPNTPKTDAYNTAPSTPSGTPDDRKRKSSM